MAADEKELMTEENYELVGEWEPVIFNEYAISLSHLKKGR